MTIQKKNKLRAFFLLTVFSLNTVIGFACSVGIKMFFNTNHHKGESGAVVHVHTDGKKHIHNGEKEKQDHNTSHHNGDKNNHHSKEDKNNCCKDEALKFQQLDKSLPQSVAIIHPTFLIAFFDVYYDAGIADPGIVKNIKQFVRSYHPPISNILIAIQSFRI